MATAAKPKLKRSRKQAVNELTALILDHVRDLPVDEQERRIGRFSQRVDDINAARAKSPASGKTAAKSR